MGLFTRISRKQNKQTFGSLKESGNVFLMLFGAVGMVGVIGASTMTVMKGPVRTMAQVTKQTLTENEMIAAGKLALISATQNGGNCDGDTTVEPLPMTGNTIPGFTGGSDIPTQIGTSKEDSWGMRYGYCAWDHGLEVGTGCAGSNYRAGTDNGDQYVIAIVSAGPDGAFQTSCNDYIDANTDNIADVALVDRAGGSDDLFLGYTYSEAAAASGGLWNEEGANEATIARDVTITDSAGTNDQFSFEAASGDLAIAGTGQFPTIGTDNLQSFSGAGGTINVDSTLSSNSEITTTDSMNANNIGATGDLSVNGNTSINGTLSVDGNSSLDAVVTNSISVTNNAVVGGTFGVNGDTNLVGTLNAGVTGVASLSSGADLTVNGNSILGNELTDTVAIAGNTTMAGTLGVTGTGTFTGGLNIFDRVRIQTNSSTVSDIGFHANGLLEADSNMVLSIDSDNNNTDRAFIIQKDSEVNAGTELFRINESGLVTVQGRVTNLATPTDATDATTKAYVDTQIASGTGFSENDPTIDRTGSVNGQYCLWNGSQIVCNGTTSDNDTLATLSCTNGQVAKYNGSAWACADDDNTGSGGGGSGGSGGGTEITIMDPIILGTNSITHGLSSTPSDVVWYFENKIAEHGYTPGEKVFEGSTTAFTVSTDSSDLTASVFGSLTIVNKNGTSREGVTRANWKLGAIINGGSGGGGGNDNLGNHTATQGIIFFNVAGAAAPTK